MEYEIVLSGLDGFRFELHHGVLGGFASFAGPVVFAHVLVTDRLSFAKGIHRLKIIRRAIESPIRMLCANAGVEGSVVVAQVAAGKGNYGYNVATGDYEDLVKAGVVDPTKVTRMALQNAASIAGLLLTIECMITEIPADQLA